MAAGSEGSGTTPIEQGGADVSPAVVADGGRHRGDGAPLTADLDYLLALGEGRLCLAALADGTDKEAVAVTSGARCWLSIYSSPTAQQRSPSMGSPGRYWLGWPKRRAATSNSAPILRRSARSSGSTTCRSGRSDPFVGRPRQDCEGGHAPAADASRHRVLGAGRGGALARI